jgi:inner membrane protein
MNLLREEYWMNFKTHVIGGICAGVIANDVLIRSIQATDDIVSPMFMSTLFVAGAVVGSLIPDIDHRGSYFGRRAKLLSVPMHLLAGHRGITHTPLLLMLIMSLLWFISKTFLSGIKSTLFMYMSLGIGVGMASHIFLDSLTKGGVPLLYPFSSKKISLLPLKTGSFSEKIVALVMSIGTIWFVLEKHWLL